MAPTPLLLDTAVLSQMVDDVLRTLAAQPGVSIPHPERLKSAALTACARRVRGPRADWGHLTQATTPIVAQGAEKHAALLAGLPAGSTVWVVQYDERDDWARAPTGPFTTRDAALAAVAADTWWNAEGYDRADVLAHLATHDRFTFFASDDDEDGDASPYSIDIHPLVVPA